MGIQSITQPLYKHDCEDCVYLGSKNEKDFYYCKSNLNDSTNVALIVRLSDKPKDYFSMPLNTAEQMVKSGELAEPDDVFYLCYKLYL